MSFEVCTHPAPTGEVRGEHPAYWSAQSREQVVVDDRCTQFIVKACPPELVITLRLACEQSSGRNVTGQECVAHPESGECVLKSRVLARVEHARGARNRVAAGAPETVQMAHCDPEHRFEVLNGLPEVVAPVVEIVDSQVATMPHPRCTVRQTWPCPASLGESAQ